MEWIIPIGAGIIAGICTGLIPGLHINLVATILLLFSQYLLGFLLVEHLVIFIITMGVIHSFIDFIPSIVFGVPSSDTALSVLPAHQLVLEGNAKEALFLSASGSLLGALFSLPLLFLLFIILPPLLPIITPYIPYGLLAVVVWFFLEETSLEKKFIVFIFLCISTILGLLLLNSFHLREPLLVMFTGIFGTAGLIYALIGDSSSPPFQNPMKYSLPSKSIQGIIAGNFCACLCSVLPGLGNAQAVTLLTLFVKQAQARLFLVITSSVNTTAFLVSIVALAVIERARNGAIVVVSQLIEELSVEFMIYLIIIACVICCVGFLLTLLIGSLSISVLTKISEIKLNLSLIAFLIIIVFVIENWYGVVCLIATTALGFFGLMTGIRRVHFMSILLIPVALFLL